jgi:hypothetical protein
VDDNILRLLALRQLMLVHALQQRGHAAMHAIEAKAQLDSPQAQRWREGALPTELKKARSHAEWSAMSQGFSATETRDEVIQNLADFFS